MRKMLCRAGSCTFPHFSSAGIDPHLHPGSRPGRRDSLSAEEGVGQIIWQLMEKGVLGTFIYLKKHFKQKKHHRFLCLSSPLFLPPPWGCPLPPLHKEPSPTCLWGWRPESSENFPSDGTDVPTFRVTPTLDLDLSTWASLPSTLLAPFGPSVSLLPFYWIGLGLEGQIPL